MQKLAAWGSCYSRWSQLAQYVVCVYFLYSGCYWQSIVSWCMWSRCLPLHWCILYPHRHARHVRSTLGVWTQSTTVVRVGRVSVMSVRRMRCLSLGEDGTHHDESVTPAIRNTQSTHRRRLLLRVPTVPLNKMSLARPTLRRWRHAMWLKWSKRQHSMWVELWVTQRTWL